MAVHDNQVIIIGAGPVGLVTALRLADFGIPCVVLEAEAGLARDLRASTFHPPTLDMLDDYGLAAPLIARGLLCPSWQIRMHETGEHVAFDLSVLKDDTRHPYRLQCEQFKLCELLLERLAGEPLVEVRFGTRLERIEQDEAGVVAHCMSASGPERLTGRLLVGADGARSQVREALGLTLAGKTYPETTILATTRFAFEEHLPELAQVNYVWSQWGTYSLLRLPDIWRCSLYPEAGESIEEALTPQAVERKLQRIVPRDVPYAVEEIRAYRVHMRIVDSYHQGRVALAGDAAHINSPSGGMGMNGGIHDAFSLTRTISRIWRGADVSLLAGYTHSRRPIAADEILAQADENRGRMQERSPEKRRAMLAELQAIAADRQRLHARMLRSSMIEGLRKARELEMELA
jgi:3-(3-hydroxy-phenyl)propionate hydroxylase